MKSKIVQQLINDIKESDNHEIEIQSVSGGNNKYFGKDFKGSCILSGHPTYDVFFGIYYITTSMEFLFI